MNFQSLPIPLPCLQESPEPLLPARQCGCRCIAACRCACACRDHCTCSTLCSGQCGAAGHISRNLVVSLDGDFMELGAQNTTVLELHSHILIDPSHKQFAYYDSGFGSSSCGAFRRWVRRLDNAIDRVVGWNFQKTIVKAYRWLCEQYQPGDRIFLFGFSRGAYEVQTLATMIETVGLVNAGNHKFIISAYDVFCQTQQDKALAHTIRAAEKFKSTFSRNVKVHFVGVWDTAPSASVLGQKPGPIPLLAERICIFRHAMALDECRMDFLAAGASQQPPTLSEKSPADSASTETKISTATAVAAQKRARPFKLSKVFRRRTAPSGASSPARAEKSLRNIKQIWFPGTHADMGGGLKPDVAFNLSSVPLSWMETEAISAGLRLRPRVSDVKSKWDTLQEIAGKHSLSSLRRFWDSKSLRHVSHGSSRTPLRTISQGQRIHASVAFQPKNYRPQVKLLDGDSEINWKNIAGQNAQLADFDWVFECGDRLETNFFDSHCMMEAVRNLSDLWRRGEFAFCDRESFWIERLSFMALSGDLCTTYLATTKPVWDDDRELELACAVKFFERLAESKPAIFTGDLAEILEAQGRFLCTIEKGDPEKLLEEALRLRRVAAAVPLGSGSRNCKLAASLILNASYAVVQQKPQKARYFFDESVDILRQLLAEEYHLAFPLFAHLQRNLSACLKALSHDSSALRLAETVVALSRTLLQTHPRYSAVLAAALHDLAFGFPRSLSAQEPHAAEEAINMYRNLAGEDPDAYAVPFADALNNYSGQLFVAGLHEKAYAASLEEAQIRRKAEQPDGLATCLEQLSRCLRGVGKIKAAVESAEEAVRIRRKLVEENGAWQLEMQLADSFHNLSCCRSLAPGCTSKALDAAREAVSTQRGLSKDLPTATFNVRLAIFLHNFSVSLSEAGRHDEALRAAEEAVQIRVSWGDDSDCALSLSRVAACLSAVGRQDEALGVADKCFDLVHSVVLADRAHKSERQRTEIQLAEALCALSACFVHSRALQAVQAAGESVRLYRKLVRCNFTTAVSNAFTRALLQLSSLLLGVGQHDEALRIAVEAAQVGNGLAADVFSQCLYHLSICLYLVGKQEQGMLPAQQCVELRRGLVRECGEWQLKEQLADALFNLSLYPSHPPCARALQAVREAVVLQRQLGGHLDAERYSQRLADGLQNLAARCLIAGEDDEALACAEEALGIARALVALDAAQHTASLLNILYTHANVLCEHARYEDAHRAIAECDGLGQDVCGESVFASPEASAAYMSTRARCLIGVGRRDEGLRGLLEAIRLYKRALARPPRHCMFESFPWFLNNALASICELRRASRDALSATAEVVEVAQLLAEYAPEQFEHYLKLAVEFHVGSLSGE